MFLRPILSDSEAQKMRPSALNKLIRPTRPAAEAAMAAFCAAVILAMVSTPSSLAPNMSCSIGLAIEMTPIPAVTFRHNTPQISQNCGVLQDVSRCTLLRVIIPVLFEDRAGV